MRKKVKLEIELNSDSTQELVNWICKQIIADQGKNVHLIIDKKNIIQELECLPDTGRDKNGWSDMHTGYKEL